MISTSVLTGVLPQLHEGALAELLLDLQPRRVQGLDLLFLRGGLLLRGGDFLFCHPFYASLLAWGRFLTFNTRETPRRLRLVMPISITGSLGMSSRTILLAFLGACAAAACAAAAYAADWSTFVAASNRADDGLILDILKDADFQTSSEICLAIGTRSDPYAADILSWLLRRLFQNR